MIETPALPVSRATFAPDGAVVINRVNSGGKSLGQRMFLTGDSRSASDRRKEGKELGLKGKELSTYVNAGLSGDAATESRMRLMALVQKANDSGFVPDVADLNTKGDKMLVRFIKPKAPKPDAAVSAATKKGAEYQAAAKAAEDKLAETKKAIAGAIALLAAGTITQAEFDAKMAELVA